MKKLILALVLFTSTLCTAQITATTSHTIVPDSAFAMTERFRHTYPDLDKGKAFGKNAIQDILNQADAQGMMVYCGLTYDGKLTFVIDGIKTVSGKNKDMWQGKIAERGDCCAAGVCCSITDNTNPLNTDQ